MLVFTTVASLVNYASNLIFSRVLDPVGFGELTALMAFVVFVAVPTGAAQTMLAERIARLRSDGEDETIRYLLRYAISHVVVIAAIATAVYAACVPLVVELFDLREPGPALALIPVVFTAFLTPIALGALQGFDRFFAFGLMILAMACARIIFGVPWTWAGGGPGGALGGYGVGMLVVLAFTAYRLRHLVLGRGTGTARRGLRRRPDGRTLIASGAFMAFAIISNLDVLLAKVFLSPEESGVYAAVATVGKVVLFLPSAIAVVMVPNAARARHTEGSSQAVLRIAAFLVAATAACAAVPAAIAPDLVVELMFGDGYEEAADGVLPIVVAGACLALLNLLVVYSVAIDHRRWTYLLVGGIALQALAVALFHDSAAQIATVQAIVMAGVLVVNEAFFHSIVWRGRSTT